MAPCYESCALEFTVHDSAGSVVASHLAFPKIPTTLWLPNEPIEERTLIRLPSGLASGE